MLTQTLLPCFVTHELWVTDSVGTRAQTDHDRNKKILVHQVIGEALYFFGGRFPFISTTQACRRCAQLLERFRIGSRDCKSLSFVHACIFRAPHGHVTSVSTRSRGTWVLSCEDSCCLNSWFLDFDPVSPGHAEEVPPASQPATQPASLRPSTFQGTTSLSYPPMSVVLSPFRSLHVFTHVHLSLSLSFSQNVRRTVFISCILILLILFRKGSSGERVDGEETAAQQPILRIFFELLFGIALVLWVLCTCCLAAVLLRVWFYLSVALLRFGSVGSDSLLKLRWWRLACVDVCVCVCVCLRGTALPKNWQPFVIIKALCKYGHYEVVQVRQIQGLRTSVRHVKQVIGDDAIDVDGQAPSTSEKLASASSHFGQEVFFVRPHRSKRVLVTQAQRKTNVVID